jgi:hypothetical protein
MKKSKSTAVALILAMMTLLVGATQSTPVSAASAISIPITGSGSGAVFKGNFNLQKFAVKNGQVVAIGTIVGTLTDALGVVTNVLQNIALPVHVGQTTCDILHLDLGPLSIDLLGLQIDLSRIVLDITAQAGAGNLLGNLLCGVAGLLDQPSSLANLLNQILAAL